LQASYTTRAATTLWGTGATQLSVTCVASKLPAIFFF